jgi:hypothetical protein
MKGEKMYKKIKITNKEFGEFVKQLTKPEIKMKDLAKQLDLSVQQLNYHARIKPAIDPDGELRNDFAHWMQIKKHGEESLLDDETKEYLGIKK